MGRWAPLRGPVCAREVYSRKRRSGKKTSGDEELQLLGRWLAKSRPAGLLAIRSAGMNDDLGAPYILAS
jgi:hypothetical protein